MILRQSLDVTPDGADVDIDSEVKAIRVGKEGNLRVILSKDSEPITLEKVGPNDPLLPLLRIKKILHTGTTAQNIIALW